MALKNPILYRSVIAPACAVRGVTQTRHIVKVNKLNTLKASSAAAAVLHRTAPVHAQPEDIPKCHQEHIHHSESSSAFTLQMFKTGNSLFLEGNCLNHPFSCMSSSSSSSSLWDLFRRHLVPSAPEVVGFGKPGEAGRGLRGTSSWKSRCMENSWWVFDPIGSPSGSGHSHSCPRAHLGAQKFAGLKLYQNHPQVHPSQSFPQPHPACLSFID